MKAEAAAYAAVEKLSRALSVPPTELGYLHKLPAATLTELADRVGDAIHADGEERFRRLATIAGFVPGAAAAAVAQHVLGALVAARVAAQLSPDKAAELARHLPAPFLTEVSLHLDPRRTAGLIDRLDDDLVVAVGHDLVAREEHVTLGRFVGYVSADVVRRAVEPASPATLLRTARFVEDESRLDDLVGQLPDDRLGAVVATADEQGQLPVLLPLVAAMGEATRRRIAALPYLQEADVVERVVAAAAEHDLAADLAAVTGLLPPATQELVAAAWERAG